MPCQKNKIYTNKEGLAQQAHFINSNIFDKCLVTRIFNVSVFSLNFASHAQLNLNWFLRK